MEMKPFYAAGKIRMATGGRGFWETDLAVKSRPLAQPMTKSDIIYNSSDTVQFESYSIVLAEGAKWQWAFSPAPLYVSSLTARNPKVVFGSKGSFDATLTVTDADNQTSTKTVPAMVTIADPANPDPLAGQALQCAVKGDYAVTENLGLTTNVMTISAWVNPDGIQPDYSAIVMNNGTGAGFNFRGGNNTLGYHWPGGSWSWDSKLIVPAGRWSHVAMVANGSSMTLYVNGIPSKNTASLQNAPINTMNIGNYMGWGDRNFKGMIDEVCIWKRALSQDEIRKFAHLTKGNMTSDTEFIAYYQFNETGGDLFNRMSSGMGSYIGSPAKVISSAPVGEGTSTLLTVNAGGNFDFTGTGFSMTYPSGTLFPGDIVVTRLQTLPATPPNANPNLGCYWLFNAYGSDHFTPITELRFTSFSGVPADTIIRAPSQAKLFARRIGETTNSWETLCGAVSVTPGANGVFRFNSTCPVSINGSLYLSSDNINMPLLKGTTSGIDNRVDPGETFVRVYPNPVSTESDIRFEYPGNGPVHIKLFDSAGKLLKDIKTNGPCTEIVPASGLPAGICFYTVQSDTKMRSGRIVVK
jgi:PKD repeat protein